MNFICELQIRCGIIFVTRLFKSESKLQSGIHNADEDGSEFVGLGIVDHRNSPRSADHDVSEQLLIIDMRSLWISQREPNRQDSGDQSPFKIIANKNYITAIKSDRTINVRKQHQNFSVKRNQIELK